MQHPDQQVAPVADMTVKHQCSPEADEYDESRFTMEMANDESDPFNPIERAVPSEDTSDTVAMLTGITHRMRARPDRPCRSNRLRPAIYHQLFSEAEDMLFDVLAAVFDALLLVKKMGFEDDDVDRIWTPLTNYTDYRSFLPDSKTDALVGPMGTGKSKLLSCLLGTEDVALSDDGDRGTHVVSEFCGPEVAQQMRFRVKGVYRSDEETMSLMRSLVNDVMDYLEVKDQAGLPDGGEAAAEAVELKMVSDKAVQILTTMLCDVKGFFEEETTMSWFEDQHRSKTSREEIMEFIIPHIERLKNARGVADDQIEVHNADDVFELGEIFKQLSTPTGADDGPHPWPLISKVEVHCKEDLLETGIIIADTPGLEDKNRYVAQNNERYLKEKADKIFLVAQYLRLENKVEPMLERCLQAGKISRTELVVTKMDPKDLLKRHEIEELEESVKRNFARRFTVTEHPSIAASPAAKILVDAAKQAVTGLEKINSMLEECEKWEKESEGQPVS
ncbi:hypothetical protein CLAFUW4_03060 [Fulvia fulva]|nr:hypothetical protein CLAFUR4_03053 [Fulvia fulva]WPV11196.1 hypothetical protein CLAFUW4_03060 [Fulvia fulva]WPV26214.1 hypothetical protein CLAFUW7_03057 [Fulvia fulva]